MFKAALAFIPGWAKMGAVALLALFLAYLGGKWHGGAVATAEIKAAAARAALERIQELEKNNAQFLGLPARERCLMFARDSELPESICD